MQHRDAPRERVMGTDKETLTNVRELCGKQHSRFSSWQWSSKIAQQASCRSAMRAILISEPNSSRASVTADQSIQANAALNSKKYCQAIFRLRQRLPECSEPLTGPVRSRPRLWFNIFGLRTSTNPTLEPWQVRESSARKWRNRESKGGFGDLQTSVQESDKSVTSRAGGIFILSLKARRILARETFERSIYERLFATTIFCLMHDVYLDLSRKDLRADTGDGRYLRDSV
jgi:hypothetical protein